MQTFLPYANFKVSARCLDNKRLGKQRVETYQILNTLKNGGGWSHHPAVLMWKGYENALVAYGEAICERWIDLDFVDNMLPRIRSFTQGKIVLPPWIGNPVFHDSHKSNLLRKKPEHYKQFNWGVPDNLPYVWPVKKNSNA